MDVSKDPKIVEYASTITGLPEFYLMKQTLEEVFGQNEFVTFENIESMRKVIEQIYSDKELGLLTGEIENIDICKTFEEE